MFLKRIEMQGFKSFADKVVINFDQDITGVVGPNGCGKSNITDAIRWVLGEQSAKSLRGNSMYDVIFAGSADRRMINMAEVTLVFDNSNHGVNSDADEVEVTRRLYRNTQEGMYLINHNQVRLKDVIDLILDTGLGKDSLSMISQGNVAQFADAKPFERRAIFEEAAGVAKYKKRKIESLSKLERTKENIDRLQDIVNELEKQISPLKRQAKKAEIYREKKERLQQIEISVLVSDIDRVNEEIENNKKVLFDLDTQSAMYSASLQIQENEIVDNKRKINDLEKIINTEQEQLIKIVNEIQILETRKIELDEKRKYAIETGNDKQKSIELQSLINDARLEYENRLERLNKAESEMNNLQTSLSNTALSISDMTMESENAESVLRRLNNRKDVLENMASNPFNNQYGVKSIMDNKTALHGILGVAAQVLKPQKGYEEAINTALGGSLYNIVVNDEKSARSAIEFLKRNQSGRATFLPLTVCTPHYIRNDHQLVCKNSKGYLGLASEFISCDEVFDPVVDTLLNNIIVMDNLENGNELNRILKYAYKIVTLDGDVINRGGSMTGGKVKNAASIMTVNKELEEINVSIISQTAKCERLKNQLNALKNTRSRIEQDLYNDRITLARLEPVVEAKRAKYEKLQHDLDVLDPKHEASESSVEDDLIIRLNTAYKTRDDLNTAIKTNRDTRMKLSSENERKEQQSRQIRKDLNDTLNRINDIKISQAKSEAKLEASVTRLSSEYQMTYEYAKANTKSFEVENAKEEVALLRSEIIALGNVNMNAPEEFTEVNDRYETMNKQMEELMDSRDKLLKAIDQMDGVMTKKFKEMFISINNELNDTFKALFGGGKAKLVLEDPSDILNTGIDIDVQPPGKAVQNIRLFSGGEKTLIAICVLFSILKVKPVPLVVFDEVEAALDQGNVERFAKYLKTFTPQTQFIVVTHRPGTMEQCNVLYGVTMQKQGVSQMLKVELKDAIEMADKKEDN